MKREYYFDQPEDLTCPYCKEPCHAVSLRDTFERLEVIPPIPVSDCCDEPFDFFIPLDSDI